MRLSDFDYQLPEELIAQEPPAERDGARMLVLHRNEQQWEDRLFRDLPLFLRAGDCLVLNDSRVLPSRLLGHREPDNRAVEVMLIEPVSPEAREWRALVKPGRHLRTGDIVRFDERTAVAIVAHGERGERTVRFLHDDDVFGAIERLGRMPLPPYIRRAARSEDRERYQTVFARERGSVAAPTAGLHFTGEILEKVRQTGARTARVTLHVGLGTFQPVDREDFESHQLHYERYSISKEAWADIETANRVLAVGTTSTRTIEAAAATGELAAATNLFIYPGYRFRRTGAMLTNFHSSLLLLVCAFAGQDFTLAAYRHAVENRYRFFSYGDCMLIL
jgi:S-adenosylmethionine:tRNA ribosyltransferase-isomerase